MSTSYFFRGLDPLKIIFRTLHYNARVERELAEEFAAAGDHRSAAYHHVRSQAIAEVLVACSENAGISFEDTSAWSVEVDAIMKKRGK